MSAKLTAARCEALAALCARRGDDREAEVYTLAARALKAREWAEANAIPGEHVTSEFQNGTACAAGVILAILDGRTP